MRTEKEIKLRIKVAKLDIKANVINKSHLTTSYDFGFQRALEWVLEEE